MLPSDMLCKKFFTAFSYIEVFLMARNVKKLPNSSPHNNYKKFSNKKKYYLLGTTKKKNRPPFLTKAGGKEKKKIATLKEQNK
jgi:hypothetical protein